MSHAMLYCGDALTILKTLPEESVQMVCTSPPYWGLRDYGVPGQLGLERTPEEYVANMVALFREVRRVLRADGTLWLNLGDSYAATGARSNNNGEGASTMGWPGQRRETLNKAAKMTLPPVISGLKPKDLVGIPWRLAFALQADGWTLRSEIIWAKPNPMPESVADRPTKAHEYVFLLSKSASYFYDAAAIAEPQQVKPQNWTHRGFGKRNNTARHDGDRFEVVHKQDGHGRRHAGFNAWWDAAEDAGTVAATRNARTVWTIATQPYPEAHFATFPEELARRCILAGSSNKACEKCGAPWERVVERGPLTARGSNPGKPAHLHPQGYLRGGGSRCGVNEYVEDRGWQPTCSCEQQGTGRCVVLDPFGGSGTVAQVATGNGRDSIYIDLNPAYLELAKQRIGPMLCTAVA